MILAKIRGVTVSQDDNDAITWASGSAVDADGANGQNGNKFAYRYPDDDGLDYLRNAGWPLYGWRNVLLDSGSGTPLTDGNGNAYSQTTYTWRGRSIKDRYLDATSVPYVVVNPIVRRHARGIVIGSMAIVSYEGKTINAVVGDVSGPSDIGEMSIALALALGIPASPRDGGVERGVTFTLYAGQAAVLGDVIYELQPA